MRASDVYFRSPLGFPWVSALLVASCVLVSAPLYVEPHRYFLTLGVGFCGEDGAVHWWHGIVSHFVHGNGVDCGFPSTTVHLLINCALFVVQGVFVERLLGSGRVALLTLFCLAAQVVLMHFLIGGRAHGASGMTWSYLLFVIAWLYRAFRVERWRLLKEPAAAVLAASALFAIAGLVKNWHLWNVLFSVPFFLAWKKTPQPERPVARNAGVAAALSVLAFNAVFVAAAVSGRLQPVSVECNELGPDGLPCVIDTTGREARANVKFDLRLDCANGAKGSAVVQLFVEPETRMPLMLPRAQFPGCDRIARGAVDISVE